MPPRTLRVHKAISYDPSIQRFCVKANSVVQATFTYAYQAMAYRDQFRQDMTDRLTDADHAVLLKFITEPYEPEPTLEEIVQGWWRMLHTPEGEAFATLCASIRTASPGLTHDD